MSKKRSWIVSPTPSEERFKAFPGIPRATAHIAYNRGIANLAHLRSFLTPDRGTLHHASLLPDIDIAIERIGRALHRDELIAIYGDFDADGVTSTALLHEGLSALGGRTIPYIPHRTEEGHGLSMGGLAAIRSLGASLILTADCGVSSFAEVEAAQNTGIDVVITDHHSVPLQLPPAIATIDPKRDDSQYPFPQLAAVGVAYKLIQALRESLGQPEDESLLDLVALGTVADVAPLTNENRYLVKRGIEVLNNTPRTGIKELVSAAGLSSEKLDAESISFGLGPRLNAAGRVDHAITSYRLLTATSSTEAQPLAQELNLRNQERQNQTREVLEKAREKVEKTQLDQPLIIVGGEDYPAGVAGLVAAKLVEEYYRPAIVMSLGVEASRASARSIPEFDIAAALRSCDELFLRYGGHRQAAGFVILNDNLEPLQRRLLSAAEEQLSNATLEPSVQIDLELPLRQISGRLIKFTGLLPPFGYGNPPPTFLSKNVRVVGVRTLGDEAQHLRMKLRDGPAVWDAIGFNMGHHAGRPGRHLDIVHRLKMDRWGKRDSLQLELIDMAPAVSR